MPIKSKFSLLGTEVTKDTPTVEEWTKAWTADSLLKEATSNVWYRGTAAEARELFLHGQEEVKGKDGKVLNANGPYTSEEGTTLQARKGLDDTTGIPRLTKQVKKAKGEGTYEVWDESEQKFYNRVLATLVQNGKFPSIETAAASFAPMLQECVNLVPFDAFRAPPSEKKAKGIPQVFIVAATNAVAKGTTAKLAKLLTKALGRPVGETVDDLSKAMKEDSDNQASARQKELAAIIGA